jgi:tetratricopeptide (TPR) repeat protein
MSLTTLSNHALVLLLALLTAFFTSCATRQTSDFRESDDAARLGKITFPTSAKSAQAQAHFLRGVAALHSFWYRVALDEFRAATRIEPDFMMGYWGEAMAHNHPIWGDPQETEAARKALQKIKDTAKLTPCEQAWVNAVQILYGDGDKVARDKAYAAAMEKIHREYPDDAEAALFYALALMGTVRLEDPAGVQTRLRAGEIAAAVYQKNPDHPGAAHYVIHAYDDPEHARMALDAARRYARIAPAAPHALHMPSHIFLQLGMWPEAVSSNEASWAASDEWVKQKNLPVSQRDYHSLHWLMYGCLQQGRADRAKEQLTLMRESFMRFPKDDQRNLIFGAFTQAQMAATFVIETEQWKAAEQLLPPADEMKAQPDGAPDPYQAYAVVAQIPLIFARSLAAAAQDLPAAQTSASELRAIREKASGVKEPFVAEIVRMTEIQEIEIAAMAAAAQNNFDEAISMMRKATKLEEATPPPPGPPPVIKPSHELFGELLLRAGRAKEAAEQFSISLRRHPNRARSLLGAARAAAKSGDTQSTIKFYQQFAEQWRQADASSPESREARIYLQQTSAH